MGRSRKKFKEILRRVRFYLRREQFDRELDAEMRFHLEMKARDNVTAGATLEQAEAAAIRRFGNTTLITERSREMWVFRWIDELVQDVRYSLRTMKKSPAIVAVVVLSLGLAIGANTAIFSQVDSVLLRMLPVKNPKELVLFSWLSGPRRMATHVSGYSSRDSTTGQQTSTAFSYLEFQRMQENGQALSDLFAYASMPRLEISIDGKADIESGQIVSGGYYKGLGVSAVLGRTISEEDDRPGAAPVAVVTYKFWQQKLGFDNTVIGKSIYVNGVPFSVIGVTPKSFSGALDFGYSPDVTIPISTEKQVKWGKSQAENSWDWWLLVMGRLRPGVGFEQAKASLEGVFQRTALEGARQFESEHPNLPSRGQLDTPRLIASSGSQGLNEDRNNYSKSLRILVLIVGLVLLIACANTANLLLARATARRREIAVRLAIGAGRIRLVRQLLTESLVLASIAGVLGVTLAFWGKDLLLSLSPGGDPLHQGMNLNLSVLGFTVGVSLLSGIFFGIAPALQATRSELAPALKESSTSQSQVKSRLLLNKALVVAQVAVSLLLLVGAGLFLATLRNLNHVNYGFNANNLLLFNVNPTLNGYKGGKVADLDEEIIEKVQAISGVQNATMSDLPLISGAYSTTSGTISLDGSKVQVEDDNPIYSLNVRDNFFDVMGIPILLGRPLVEKDDVAKVAVINQSFANRYFPNESPIGRLINLDPDDQPYALQVVGVARDTKYDSLRKDTPPTLYQPYALNLPYLTAMSFEVRTGRDPNAIAPAIRQAVQSVDSNLAVFAMRTQLEQ
ncbi:MAG TPA: ABC transporter permease, partial [Blastocatellia bacterium]|nr:ABC transporter permease [Blastocatellia bacterium]